jgi:hypothetical protein
VSNKALARESRAGSIGQRATRQKEGELVRYSSEREQGDMSEGERGSDGRRGESRTALVREAEGNG